MKVLEMMAHEVPIVATDGPAVSEILQPDWTAPLVEPDNPPALARAEHDRAVRSRGPEAEGVGS